MAPKKMDGSVIVGLQKQPTGKLLISGANFPTGTSHVHYPHIDPNATVQELRILQKKLNLDRFPS